MLCNAPKHIFNCDNTMKFLLYNIKLITKPKIMVHVTILIELEKLLHYVPFFLGIFFI